MHTNSRTYIVFKNAFYNFVGYIWPIFFALIITPIIIFRLGIKEYGIYIFIGSIISLLGVLDLGFGTSLTKHIAQYRGQNDDSSSKKLIYSANSFFLLISILVFIIITIFSLNLEYIISNKYLEYTDHYLLLIMAGGIFLINTITLPYAATLHGLQRYDLSNSIGIVSGTASSLIMLTIVLMGGGLNMILLSQLFISLFVLISTFYLSKKILPGLKYILEWDNTQLFIGFKFGLMISINSLASSVANSLNKMIIPFYIGPSNLTYYNMANTISSKTPGISGALTVALFPTSSDLHGSNRLDLLSVAYKRSLRLISIISAAVSITIIAFSYEALFYWLNSDFAEKSYITLILLALASFLFSLYNMLTNFLMGLGKVKLIIFFSVLISTINIVLLFVLLPKYGMIGVAISYLLSQIPVIFILYYSEKKIFFLEKRTIYNLKFIGGVIFVSILILFIDHFFIIWSNF